MATSKSIELSDSSSDTPLAITSPTSPTNDVLRISVVVLSKDEPDLARSLELLLPQCNALGAECIVVDASDGRLESVHQDHLWTKWIDYSPPFWRSSTIPHQRNVGCRAATGHIIAFCDSGGEPDASWLATLTAPLLSKTFTLVCGPIYAKRPGVYSVINDVADGETLFMAPTANMAFLKTVFDQVGEFDERLYYGSDSDFVWRSADAGHACYQVRNASMLMDFGPATLTLRRSWRYGRGWARLFGVHPQRRLWMLKKSPERAIYPIWILLGPLALVAACSRKLRWVLFAWIGMLSLPLVRNRKTPSPRAVVADHIVGGASVLDESFRHVVGEAAPVIFIPGEESPYLRNLADALEKQGTAVGMWRGPTKSATLNILLGPILAILMAWRGTRIIHVHWVHGFSRSSSGLAGRFFRWWFGVFLKIVHVFGLKVVWTVHNILPHDAVFDDDAAARQVLAVNADAVIALSPQGAQEVREVFGATRVTVISHGPLQVQSSSVGREGARVVLGVGQRTCFTFFGHVRPYKGLETLITAARLLGPSVAVRITGLGDCKYVDNLSKLVAEANDAGADLQFKARWQSEAELADLLAASDICVFPFKFVDNSGSVLLALGAGLPVIIPDLSSLRHLDNAGVLRYDPADPVESLLGVMTAAANLSETELLSLSSAAREWASGFSWTDIADQTTAVYSQAARRE
jgi:beta-1,4-mannosyltransferase